MPGWRDASMAMPQTGGGWQAAPVVGGGVDGGVDYGGMFNDMLPQPAEDLADRAAGMSAMDLSIARAKNDAFGDYLREQAKQRKPGETDEQMSRRQYGSLPGSEGPGKVEGMARSYVQGGTFGAGDEIVAAGTAALDSAFRGENFGDAYDARLSGERGKLSRFRDTDPVAAYGTEIAGAIPTAMLPFLNAPRAVQTAGMGTRMAVGAGVGAGQGAVYGFNSGDGSFADRLRNAAPSAAIGGGVGALAPPIAAGGGRLAQMLMERSGAQTAGLPRQTYNVLANVLGADDSLSGAASLRLRAGGPDAMLADAGPNAVSLLDTAIQRSGPAATVARNAVEGRVYDASRNVTRALDSALGAPEGVATAETALRRGTAGARRAAYDAAYAVPIDYAAPLGQRIEQTIASRVPGAAIRQANELMRIAGDSSRQILADIAEDGTVTFRQLPDVRQIDYITRALNAMAQQSDTAGAMGGQTPKGAALQSLSRDLRAMVREAVPEYGVALDAAAEPISARNALQLGRRLLSPSMARDEVVEAMRGMSTAERQNVAQGVRAQMDEAFANVKRAMTDGNMDAREALKALRDLSSRAARDKVTAVIGPENAMRLFGQLDSATRAFELRAGVTTNSRTFARTAMDDTVRQSLESGPLNALRGGHPIVAGRNLVAQLLGRSDAAKQEISDAAYLSMAEALTGIRGPRALQLLDALRQAQTIGPRADVLRNAIEAGGGRNAAVTVPGRDAFR